MLQRGEDLRLDPDDQWLADERVAAPVSHLSVDPDNLWNLLSRQDAYAAFYWQDFAKSYHALRADLAGLIGGLVPQSIYVLLGVLTFLLLACITVPMLFLSSEGWDSKAVLLVAFTAGGLAFLAYLWYEVRRINRAADLSAAWTTG